MLSWLGTKPRQLSLVVYRLWISGSIGTHLVSLTEPTTDPNTSESWQQVAQRLGGGVIALHKVVVQMKSALESPYKASKQTESPLTQSEIGRAAHQLFDLIDENSDGVIDRAEFRKLQSI